eukprot:3037037-Amphidinium_carterae.1
MSPCTFKSLQEEGMKQTHCMPTAWWHAMSGHDRLTNSPLKKHSASPSRHVQSGIEGIERVAAL